MKILCLHGLGSSGFILEKQLSNLRRELDPSFDLVFVDGPFETERGPGVSKYESGPFFSHTQDFSPAEISQAIQHLQDTLEEQGPFDGIFGFSQGSALTLAYLYQQQTAGDDVPVKFACLFSSAMPISPDVSLGETIISKLRGLEYDVTGRSDGSARGLTREEQEFVQILQRTVLPATIHHPEFPWPDLDAYAHGELEAIPRVMYPTIMTQRIQIPTVHSWGLGDIECLIRMSELSRSICEESVSRTVLHSGAHDMPKKPSEIKALLRMIDWAIVQT
ncbi:DUF341 domain-containing protein [Astrocystis sublimbata]|nr:DUF341 domain-containing protein [Astrocystis sublimbata]